MHLSPVLGAKTAKLVAFLTVFALIISLLPVSAFAEEIPAEPENNTLTTAQVVDNNEENHLEVTICHAAGESGNYTKNTVDEDSIDGINGHGNHEGDIIPPFADFLGLNWDAEGQAIWNNDCVVPDSEDTNETEAVCEDDSALNYNKIGECVYEEPEPEACEIEGHKYDEEGTPLSGWVIGLMKVLSFGDSKQTVDLNEDTTDDDGYYCLEWDGYTNTEVIDEPHSFSYRVYEVLKSGWNYLSIEQGTDIDNLTVVDDADIEVEDGRVSAQIGEENGYIYANAEHHFDFYNKQIIEEGPSCKDEVEGSWADDVVEYDQNDTKDNGPITDVNRLDPEVVLGESDWTPNTNDSTGFFSLGFGGSITVSFDSYVPNVLGTDLTIFEATNGDSYPTETVTVEVSQDGDTWFAVGFADNSNLPSRTTAVDFAPSGFDWIKYVRITDTTDPDLHDDAADGFDLDAIEVTQQLCTEPEDEDDGGDGGDGGDDDDDTPTRRGGGGGGTRINRAPSGEVLGASSSTPAGLVLGDSTSTLPVGAPNTGAGGTSPVSVSLPTMVAILGTVARKIK